MDADRPMELPKLEAGNLQLINASRFEFAVRNGNTDPHPPSSGDGVGQTPSLRRPVFATNYVSSDTRRARNRRLGPAGCLSGEICCPLISASVKQNRAERLKAPPHVDFKRESVSPRMFHDFALSARDAITTLRRFAPKVLLRNGARPTERPVIASRSRVQLSLQ